MKRISLLLAAVFLLAALPGCGGALPNVNAPTTLRSTAPTAEGAPEDLKTWISQDPDDLAFTYVDERHPAAPPETYESSALGNGCRAFYRFSLPAALPAQNLRSAYVFFKLKQGDAPAVRAVRLGRSWVTFQSTWADNEGALTADATPVGSLGADGWYKIELTGLVRGWLSGQFENNGFALEETQAGKTTVLYAFQSDYCPRLEVSYLPAKEGERFGKYGFEPQEAGNCMSYALRDTDMILEDALFEGSGLQTAYDTGGLAGAAAYTKERVVAYVEAHKDALKIASLRAIEGHGADIDPAAEYRVALRVGVPGPGPGEWPIKDMSFDFHFWVQLADGSWAEKTPQEPARVVPGSNRGFDPGKYPWNMGYLWGYAKNQSYYTSDVFYFAVTKSVDNFTNHIRGTAGAPSSALG
jgi:hypothetical protein